MLMPQLTLFDSSETALANDDRGRIAEGTALVAPAPRTRWGSARGADREIHPERADLGRERHAQVEPREGVRGTASLSCLLGLHPPASFGSLMKPTYSEASCVMQLSVRTSHTTALPGGQTWFRDKVAHTDKCWDASTDRIARPRARWS